MKAALPNTQKQSQGGCQNEEIRKHGPNERTDQNSRKRDKRSGDKQSLRCRFKTLVIRMFKELSEDLRSIKKIQSEMKDTLIEIKTIYRETTVQWMKPRIESMIWNIRKQKTTNQNNKKKKESKRTPQNKNTIAASGTTSEGPTFAL